MKLEHYVEVHELRDYDPVSYLVWFNVRGQSFQIAGELETRQEAEWWRDQFLNALRVMVSEVTDS